MSPNANTFSRTKVLTVHSTTAADGTALVFQGATATPTGEASGVLETKAQYDAFVSWWGLRRPVLLTDDTGRTQSIYIESFTPTSAATRRSPYRCKYVLKWQVLDVLTS